MLAAKVDAQARRRHRDKAAAERAVERRSARADRVLSDLEIGCVLLLTAALTAAGFYRSDYSRWRRRQCPNNLTHRPPHSWNYAPSSNKLSAGDLSVLPALRRVLDEQPALWRHVGDLAGPGGGAPGQSCCADPMCSRASRSRVTWRREGRVGRAESDTPGEAFG